MATSNLGKPAINDPREFSLRGVQQVIGNIRERFKGVDSAIATLQTNSATAFSVSGDLATIKKQLVNLQAEIDALEAIVDGLETGGFETDPRTEQLAGELQALQAKVDGIDDVGQTPTHAALLKGLQDQVDSLNLTVLL